MCPYTIKKDVPAVKFEKNETDDQLFAAAFTPPDVMLCNCKVPIALFIETRLPFNALMEELND